MKSFQLLLFICFIGLSLSVSEDDVVNCAQNKVGCAYVYGAAGPDTFDCSGLAYYCHNEEIPRVSYDQYAGGDDGSGQRGDLAFFNTDGSGASHTAICIGDGQMIHAENPSTGVHYDSYETNSYYVDRLLGFKRYVD